MWSDCVDWFDDVKKNIARYFREYISKGQPLGNFQLKKSIATTSFLKETLVGRRLRPSHQRAHTVNQMLTTLEGRGIVRVTTQEIHFAAEYDPSDLLNADFIRSFQTKQFSSHEFVRRADRICEGQISNSNFHATSVSQITDAWVFGIFVRLSSTWSCVLVLVTIPFEFFQGFPIYPVQP